MKKYTNEADFCPVCKSSPSDYNVADGSGVDGNVQIEFECMNCGSTWDVIYNAIAVINLEKRHEDKE
jgi:formate dehydrogenase maturation protein FdhE